MKALLIPFAWIFAVISGVRNFLYDKRFFKTEKIQCRILSVGNITAGGTGKTPITAEIVQILKSFHLNVGLVSRGYRGTYKGIQKVPFEAPDALVYGDEPAWLAQELQIPVYVGRSKVEAAQKLAQNEKVDWIVADDAFQHRRLERELDVVVLDVTEPLANYRLLPLGRARERLSALNRASLVILNKTNFISKEDLARFKTQLTLHYSKNKPIVELEYAIDELLDLKKEGRWAAETLSELKIFLVSGLGRPQSFASLLKDMAHEVVGHLSFADHHHYTSSDVHKIEKQVALSGAEAIVVTQKDAVKLRKFSFSKPVFVTCLVFRKEGLSCLRAELQQILKL